MQCRDCKTAEKILVSEVQFWLNRTSPCDPILQERNDFDVDDVTDKYAISFNLLWNHRDRQNDSTLCMQTVGFSSIKLKMTG
jgi:hypothetical protein